MAIVVFDFQEFLSYYPYFEGQVTEEQAQSQFNIASTLFLNNTDSSPVPYNPDANPPVLNRKILLYMLVCHLLTLMLRGSSVVGNLTSATEGSVSAGFTVLNLPTTAQAQWFGQTQCGAAYWAAISKYTKGPRYYDVRCC